MKTQLLNLTASKYKPLVLSLFKSYINGNIRESEFIDKLYEVENFVKVGNNNYNSDLWFRFFSGDTSANTIRDINNDLNNNGFNNYKYLIENLNIAIDSKELEIYFS